ncbi:MAG: hypothetical protein WDW38_005458 [Sanguina aurantia]
MWRAASAPVALPKPHQARVSVLVAGEQAVGGCGRRVPPPAVSMQHCRRDQSRGPFSASRPPMSACGVSTRGAQHEVATG